MSEDNGFVERPTTRRSWAIGPVTRRLIETAANSKAIPWPWSSHGAYAATLLRHGYRMHTLRVAEGQWVAWAEKIPESERPQ